MPRSFVSEARRRVGPKKQRIGPIIERLAVEHADAAIALRFRSPLELLVSVMLSAQTTDVNVNRVTATLFEKCSASSTSRPIRSGSGKPVSSKTPRPVASTRRSRSVTTKPVSGAG